MAAAAAAVATGKKRQRPHIFESNPSIRKRQQTRLLRKLRATLDEYTTRVGQQAIVLCISPSKPNPVFKVFGAAPLENVVRKYKSMMLEDLENALAEHAPPGGDMASELPPLTIDGIPVSEDKMTQARRRPPLPPLRTTTLIQTRAPQQLHTEELGFCCMQLATVSNACAKQKRELVIQEPDTEVNGVPRDAAARDDGERRRRRSRITSPTEPLTSTH